MTRKTAIRLLAGLTGIVGSAKGQSNTIEIRGTESLRIAEITRGRVSPESTAAYEKCQADAKAAHAKAGPKGLLWGCWLGSKEIPGTAVIRLYLEGFEAIEVVLDGQTRRITRQELWEAL